MSPLSDQNVLLQRHQECLDKYSDPWNRTGEVYCNATFDGYLCWPPTLAGKVAHQHCPPVRLSDTSNLAFRKCGLSGMWQTRRLNETSITGWTNYTPCFPVQVQDLLEKVYDNEEVAQVKFEIAQGTRYMEIAGFSISLVALVMSLGIFSYYRSLRNNRTRIHKNLFTAMVVQVLIRLTVYIDQAVTRAILEDQTASDSDKVRGIDNMPYLCEFTYTLLEYAISVMFMWMLIEGLYLYNMVTANALREKISHAAYLATGWGLPVVITAIWASVTALRYREQKVNICWYGYNFTPPYWIIQGPRLAIIVINLVFLLNIMKVLILKLRQSQSTEIEKVRKGVRAALVLLPLLGITNVLNMIEAPLDGSVWNFGIWSYSTHFLRSFQGFFIALIYCFLNGEVRQVVKKHYTDYMAMRALSPSGDKNQTSRAKNQSSIAMKTLNRLKGNSKTGDGTDVEIGKENVEKMSTDNKKDSGVSVDYAPENANNAEINGNGNEDVKKSFQKETFQSDFNEINEELD